MFGGHHARLFTFLPVVAKLRSTKCNLGSLAWEGKEGSECTYFIYSYLYLSIF